MTKTKNVSFTILLILVISLAAVFAVGGYLFLNTNSLYVENNGLYSESLVKDTKYDETYTISFEWDNPNSMETYTGQATDVQTKYDELVPILNVSDNDAQNVNGRPSQGSGSNSHIFLGYFSDTDANGKLYYGVEGAFKDIYSVVQKGNYDNSVIKPLGIFKETEDITLHAFYHDYINSGSGATEYQYVIADPNGGILKDDSKDSNIFTLASGKFTYPLYWPTDKTSPTRSGYKFDGYWGFENGNGDEYYDTETGNYSFPDEADATQYYNADMTPTHESEGQTNSVPITIHAKWIKDDSTPPPPPPVETYTVRLHHNDGTDDADTINDVLNGKDMPSAVDLKPSREGYDFVGYYDTQNDTGGTQYYKSDMSSARPYDKNTDLDLYARWHEKGTVVTYVVTLDKNEGTGGDDSVEVTFNQDMPSGKTAPTRDGYDFDGYFDEFDNKYYNADMTSANKWDKDDNDTLIAKWKPKDTDTGGGKDGDKDSDKDNEPDNKGKIILISVIVGGIILLAVGAFIFIKIKKGGGGNGGGRGGRKPVRRGGMKF